MPHESERIIGENLIAEMKEGRIFSDGESRPLTLPPIQIRSIVGLSVQQRACLSGDHEAVSGIAWGNVLTEDPGLPGITKDLAQGLHEATVICVGWEEHSELAPRAELEDLRVKVCRHCRVLYVPKS